MGDMGEYYRDMKELKSLHKRERVEEQKPFVAELTAMAVNVNSLPGGFRFSFKNESGRYAAFDYWPSSGKWTEVGSNRIKRGEAFLLRSIEMFRTK